MAVSNQGTSKADLSQGWYFGGQRSLSVIITQYLVLELIFTVTS